VNVETLLPRRNEPPTGWPPEVFAAVTDALAAALVASWRRAQQGVALEHTDTTTGAER
jgi:hypothetical protein